MFNAVNKLAALITVIEVVVLVEWLRLTTSAAAAVAAGFLFIGILVEELVRFRGIKTRFPQGRELALGLLGGAGGTGGGVVAPGGNTPGGGVLCCFLCPRSCYHRPPP